MLNPRAKKTHSLENSSVSKLICLEPMSYAYEFVNADYVTKLFPFTVITFILKICVFGQKDSFRVKNFGSISLLLCLSIFLYTVTKIFYSN